MTRKECSGKRDLTFSGWVRENLPNSNKGFMVSDLDFIFQNYKTKKVMLLEVKTRSAKLRKWQKILFANLDKWIKHGISKDWQYLGFHTVRFENTDFNNGRVLFDNKLVTEKELIENLSF